MASIDKIYFTDLDEALAFLKFVEANPHIPKNRMAVTEWVTDVANVVGYHTYKEFDNDTLMITNFSETTDCWLWDNCDIKTIHEQLRWQYDSERPCIDE